MSRNRDGPPAPAGRGHLARLPADLGRDLPGGRRPHAELGHAVAATSSSACTSSATGSCGRHVSQPEPPAGASGGPELGAGKQVLPAAGWHREHRVPPATGPAQPAGKPGRNGHGLAGPAERDHVRGGRAAGLQLLVVAGKPVRVSRRSRRAREVTSSLAASSSACARLASEGCPPAGGAAAGSARRHRAPSAVGAAVEVNGPSIVRIYQCQAGQLTALVDIRHARHGELDQLGAQGVGPRVGTKPADETRRPG